MESNVKELNMEEMEQVNGGLLILLAVSAIVYATTSTTKQIFGSN